MMNCANCSVALPDGANYCPKCGALAAAQPGAAPSKGMAKWLIGLLIAAAVLLASVPLLAILAAIFIPNFLHARAEAMTAADEGNLKRVSAAIERYAIDHNGAYPANLPQLVPSYLAKIPVVPGGDSGGAYDYHYPASSRANGAYEIWDDGSMDPSTLRSLPLGVGGQPCNDECKYVVYAQSGGIIGVPSQRR